jgi:hypothetical protein
MLPAQRLTQLAHSEQIRAAVGDEGVAARDIARCPALGWWGEFL